MIDEGAGLEIRDEAPWHRTLLEVPSRHSWPRKPAAFGQKQPCLHSLSQAYLTAVHLEQGEHLRPVAHTHSYHST
jgi:hypothetical protein